METIQSNLTRAFDAGQAQVALGAPTVPTPLVCVTSAWTLSGVQPTITILDDQGGSWDKVSEIVDPITSLVQTIWMRTSSLPAPLVITANSDQPDTWWAVAAAEINDNWRAAALFGTWGSNKGAGTASPSVTMLAPTTYDALFLAATTHDNVIPTFFNPPGGWDVIEQANYQALPEEGLPISWIERVTRDDQTPVWTLTTSGTGFDWVAVGVPLLPNFHVRPTEHQFPATTQTGTMRAIEQLDGFHNVQSTTHVGSLVFVPPPAAQANHFVQATIQAGILAGLGVPTIAGQHDFQATLQVGSLVAVGGGPFSLSGQHDFQATVQQGMMELVGSDPAAVAEHIFQATTNTGQMLTFDKNAIEGQHDFQSSRQTGTLIASAAIPSAVAEHVFQAPTQSGTLVPRPIAQAGDTLHTFQSPTQAGVIIGLPVPAAEARHTFQATLQSGTLFFQGPPLAEARHTFQPPNQSGTLVDKPVQQIRIRADCNALGVFRMILVMSCRRIELCPEDEPCPQVCADADLKPTTEFIASVPVDPNSLPASATAVFTLLDLQDQIGNDCDTETPITTPVTQSLGPDAGDPTKWVTSVMTLPAGWWEFRVRYQFPSCANDGPSRRIYVSST